MGYTPLSPQDGFAWFRDASGHIVALFANVVKATLTKTGGLTLLDALTGTTATFSGALTASTIAAAVATRTKKVHLPIESWTLGGTPPTAATVGTYAGLSFDADAETMSRSIEVPSDWDGASDMALKIRWTNEAGTALGDTETVIWLGSYRSKADTEALDGGTATVPTVTYTQSGAGTDKAQITSSIPIDYDDSNQPLASGDEIGFVLSRNFSTDTYGSDATVMDIWLEYQSTVLAGE